eukprot:314217-Pleurochrysis_carterae.AAC.2
MALTNSSREQPHGPWWMTSVYRLHATCFVVSKRKLHLIATKTHAALIITIMPKANSVTTHNERRNNLFNAYSGLRTLWALNVSRMRVVPSRPVTWTKTRASEGASAPRALCVGMASRIEAESY